MKRYKKICAARFLYSQKYLCVLESKYVSVFSRHGQHNEKVKFDQIKRAYMQN